MRFTLGQRIAIRVTAFALRLGAPHGELRAALERSYARRPEEVRIAMWRAVVERLYAKAG